MPLDAWPAADQAAWNAAFAAPCPLDDLFDETPPGAELRAPSRDAIATCYARWLAYLYAHHPKTLTLTPAARATQDRVIQYLHSLHGEVSPRSLYNYGVRLKRALEFIAQHEDWSWFAPILRRAERRARAARSPDQPFVPSNQLYAFGLELMRQAEEHPSMVPRARAEQYRDGLMIAFLAARPIRLRNMFELELGTQLTETSDGFRVLIPRTKTGTELEFSLSAQLSSHMTRYLSCHRLVLAAGPYGYLVGYTDQERFVWLSRSGAQLPADSFEHMVAFRTTERFNVRLTPHRFRGCAATTIAENNPEDFHIIRVILGHTTMATAERHYIRAKSSEAARLLQKVVRKKRKELVYETPT